MAFHELTHWTGHADRCARDLSGRFGSESYAELVAAFLCAEIGVSAEPRIDHAQYLTSWLKVFKSDPKALITASGKAGQAARFLTDCAQGTHTSSLHLVVRYAAAAAADRDETYSRCLTQSSHWYCNPGRHERPLFEVSPPQAPGLA